MTDITFILVIGFVLLALCYVIINLMLSTNAINKRLMYLIEGMLVTQQQSEPMLHHIDNVDEDLNEDTTFDPYEFEVE